MGETRTFVDKYGKTIAIATSVLGAVIVVATGVYVVNRTNSTSEKETNLPPEQPITSVSALGRIEPEGEVIKVSPSPSLSGTKVDKLLVIEGDLINKGDVIAITSDNIVQQAQLERAKKELKVAQANLAIVKAGAKQGTISAQEATIERLRAELQGAIATDRANINRLQAQLQTETKEKQATIDRFQAELGNAQIEFKRYLQLAEDGVISKSELDSKQLTLATAQERYQEAQASYQRTITTLEQEIKEAQALANQRKSSFTKQISEAQSKLDEIAEIRDVDVAQAQAEVARAMAVVKQADVALDLTIVKSPINGTILDIIAHEGENIENEDGLVEMGNTHQMQVVAEVYESDISKIKIGQKASIVSENNSFPNRITGEVVEISSKIGKKDVLETDPAASVDARVVEVKIAVSPQDNELIKNLIYSQVIVEILL